MRKYIPSLNRRDFLGGLVGAAAGIGATGPLRAAPGDGMKLGLVTYLWGQDMDLPTLLDVCWKSGVVGLELRTEHKHGVEPSLNKEEREEVRQQFADSPVTLVGYGSNAQFHEAELGKLQQNIKLTQDYVRLMDDCGGEGVKVKPNGFVEGVPREKTIEQIGKALNVVAADAADYGQKIRVECHGQGTSELPVMKAIFEVADHPNVYVCWNSNDEDLTGAGLEHNFNLVKDRFGDTVHIRELNVGDYPYEELMKLFVAIDYQGWLLLEARTNPADKVKALIEQRKIFEEMIRA